jgi:hypothetical protein
MILTKRQLIVGRVHICPTCIWWFRRYGVVFAKGHDHIQIDTLLQADLPNLVHSCLRELVDSNPYAERNHHECGLSVSQFGAKLII